MFTLLPVEWQAVVRRDCPDCHGALCLSEDFTRLTCQSRQCPGKLARRIEQAAKALGVKGVGPAVAAQLVPLGLVGAVGSFWAPEAMQAAGVGVGASETVAGEAGRLGGVSDAKLLLAVGAVGVGPEMAAKLADVGVEVVLSVAQAYPDGGDHGDFAEWLLERVQGLGSVQACAVAAAIREVSAELAALRRALPRARVAAVAPGGPLEGLRIAVTGSVPGLTREQAAGVVVSAGGAFAGAVSKNTKILVIEDPLSQSSKAKSARKLGVEMLTWESFVERYGLRRFLPGRATVETPLAGEDL